MVDAITSPTATIPAVTPSAAGAGGFAGAGAGGDFQTFLTMLTAQLQNQDPLNPMESTDFAIQLATFAGVEQAALSNKFLEQMAGQAGGAGIAGWIGKEGRTTAPVWFGDDAITLDVVPHSLADSVQLVTRDAQGREVTREEIGPGEGQIDWLGRDDMGQKLADGRYSFVIESSRAGEVIAKAPVGAYVRVAEAEVGPMGIELIFQGGGSALASEIEALRDPG